MRRITVFAMFLVAVAVPAPVGGDLGFEDGGLAALEIKAGASTRDSSGPAASGKPDTDARRGLKTSDIVPRPGADMYDLRQETGGRWAPLGDDAWRGAGYDGSLLNYRLSVGPYLYHVWVASRIGRVADFGVSYRSAAAAGTCEGAYEKMLDEFKELGIVGKGFKGLKSSPDRWARGSRVSVKRTALKGGAQFGTRFELRRGKCLVLFDYITRSRPGSKPPKGER